MPRGGATDGDVLLAELHVNARPEPSSRADTGDELLTWQSLTLQGLSFLMAPPARPQLGMREVTLNLFTSVAQAQSAENVDLARV